MTTKLEYYTILTDAGVVYEAECLASSSKFHLTEIAVGDGNGEEITPDAAQTELVNEVARYDVTAEELDSESGLYYAMIQIPASDGEYTIRELGGYNADGELVMVAKFPPTVKRPQETGDVRRTFIRMDLSIVNEETYPITINSDMAFASTEYVDNYVTEIYENDKNNVKLTGDQTVEGSKTFSEDIQGNCTTASKLKTSRTISLTGAVLGSVSFNGSCAVSIDTTIGSTFNSDGLTSLFTAFMPDWDNAESRSASVTYTAEVPGWVRWRRHEADKDRHLYINECVVGCARAAGSNDSTGAAALVPVTVGDTYSCTAMTEFYFMPLRGVV